MLVSCHYCGRIHEEGFDCKYKPKKDFGKIEQFRSSKSWKDKRREIRERDMFGCVCCQHKIYDLGKRQFDTESIEVHHIVPLVEDYNLRLDNNNLISLCREHHELAEKGVIDRDVLRGLLGNKYV